MISSGVAGIDSRFSIVPRSVSRVSAMAVIITIVSLQDDAQQARHDVVLRDALGVVAVVHHDAELRPPPASASVASAPCSRSSAWRATVPSVEIAPEATEGSVASASIRIVRVVAALDPAAEIRRAR